MSPHLTRLKQLKALILNHNNLLEIENIEPLLQLNTLVISHNKIDTVPRLSSLAELTKLSAAHNQLTQVPDLSHNVLLKELRLNDNKIIEIPETLRKCNSIEIMDFGNNQLTNWSDIAPLGSLLKLHNLNLKGNPLSNKKDYLEKVNTYM
jgi:Leucine-rich repeat (LRR) protein